MDPSPSQHRLRTALFGLGALLVAGLTAWLVHQVIQGYQAQLAAVQTAPASATVVVAARDLVPGVPLTAEDLRLEAVPEALVTDGGTYATTEELLGQEPLERVLAGELVRSERLTGAGAESMLNRLIAPGARAVTVLTDRAAGVGGLLRPGDRVDVICTIRPDTNALNADWVTETVLQGVRVLAVDEDVLGAQPTEDEDTSARSNRTARPSSSRKVLVTLEVLPDEAEKVALGTSRGDIHLSLRSRDDEEILAGRGPLVTNALIGINPDKPKENTTVRRTRPQPPTAAQPPARPSAEVIEGTNTTIQQFGDEGRIVDPNRRKSR